MHLSVSNAHFVAGLYGEAFRIDEHSVLTVTNANSKLDANFVTMIAWVRPIKYDVTADRGIIMNKESSYEMGIEDNTGNLQGAFNSGKYIGKKPGSTGCWRCYGKIRIPLHDWTHVAVQYDGTKEKQYVNGLLADSDTCKGDPHHSAALNHYPQYRLRIGARPNGADKLKGEPTSAAHSQFKGDIDEVMLYSAATPRSSLTAADIAYIYSGAYRGKQTNGH
jgi:hypothetical protein